MPDDFRFYPNDSRCRELAGGWLKLGIATLLMAGLYAALLVVARTPVIKFIPMGWAALIIASTGVGIIAISPFTGAGDPVMSNYIPFLNAPVFFAGLAISGSGFALLVFRALIAVPRLHVKTQAGSMRFGIYTATNAATMAILAFFWAFSLRWPCSPWPSRPSPFSPCT